MYISIIEQFVFELEILGHYKFEYRTFAVIQVLIKSGTISLQCKRLKQLSFEYKFSRLVVDCFDILDFKPHKMYNLVLSKNLACKRKTVLQ